MLEDQAGKLRRQALGERKEGRHNREGSRSVRRIAVTSGKGGVGKSNFALNTAVILTALRKRVLLIDADTNLANLDILLGIHPKYDLSDVMTGERKIHEIIIQGPGGVLILPGSSGVMEMLEMDSQVRRNLLNAFTGLEETYDFILIDTGAGLTRDIVSYVTACDEAVVVSTPEPTAISDAYAVIKNVSYQAPTLPVRVLMNMATSQEEAQSAFNRLNLVVQNFVNISLDWLGFLPNDPNVPAAVARQEPFVLRKPKSPAAVALRLAVRKLLVRRGGAGEPESLMERMARNTRDSSE